MQKPILIEVCDYDQYGTYGTQRYIRMAQLKEAREMRKKAYESVSADWENRPKECTHIVYYIETLNKHGEVYGAMVFMNGTEWTDKTFDALAGMRDVGYVGAIHRPL